MSTDCGCGSAASGDRRLTDHRSSTRRDARTTAPGSRATKADLVAGSSGPTAAGPIIRLNPTDGLFLKAEHLDQIQDYARALSLAVGQGTGTGVVYGYGLEVVGTSLTATAGLAVNAGGEPLQTTELLRLSVADDDLPALDPDGFWVVEISPDADTVGAENAYGAVCGDPCEGVDSIAPWARSLVRLRLRPDVLPGLDGHPDTRRNWLASAYFERERRKGQPWLVPGERLPGAPGTVAALGSRPWIEPGTAPTEVGVPLGVLVRIDGELVVDTWTARRDIGGAPAERRWDGHLARRSWPVFLAQLLQLEDQLRREALGPKAVDKRLVVDRRAPAVEKFIAELPAPVARWETVKELKAAWTTAEDPYLVSVGTKTLPELGIAELPPAGYLEFTVAGVEGRAELSRVLGDATLVDLEFCDVRADFVAGAVQAAQHLDRIPLDPASDPRPKVRILVPSRSADLEGVKTDAYGWVAFVRHSAADCGEQPPGTPKVEEVEVAYAFMAFDDGEELMSKGGRPSSTSLALVEFAEHEADPPPTAMPDELGKVDLLGIVAAADNEENAKLTVRRAAALCVAWKIENVEIKPVFQPQFLRPMIMIFVAEHQG